MGRILPRLGWLMIVVMVCALLPGCSQPAPDATAPEAPATEGASTPPATEEPVQAREPANPSDALELTHRLAPETYTPGEDMEIFVEMNYVGDDPITALAVCQTVPKGWTFAAVTGGITPAVARQVEDTGTIDFVWIDTPDWPNSFSYAVRVPADATGDARITGQGIYRTSGPELRTTPVEVTVPAK